MLIYVCIGCIWGGVGNNFGGSREYFREINLGENNSVDKGKNKYFNSEYQGSNILGVSFKCSPPALAYLALDNFCHIYCILLNRPLISINDSIFLDSEGTQEKFRERG